MKTLTDDPKYSRQGAQAAQTMPAELRNDFAAALGKAATLKDLAEPYKTWLLEGYTDAKVTPKENQ